MGATLKFPDTDPNKLAQVEAWIQEAVTARQEYEDAGADYAKFVTHEAEMEANRPFVKQDAIHRIMADGRIAATNAEKLAALDADYVEHLEKQRDVVAKKNDACTRMHSARLRAELAITAVRAIAGLI